MSEEKKIVVDESWKDQVEREKQEAEAKRQAAQTDGAPQPADANQPASAAQPDTSQESGAEQEAQQPPVNIPPASFEFLVHSLAAPAVMALGLAPDPSAGDQPRKVDKDMAKHYIDLLEIIEEKTKGNLTLDESGLLQRILHEVRMAYVSVKA